MSMIIRTLNKPHLHPGWDECILLWCYPADMQVVHTEHSRMTKPAYFAGVEDWCTENLGPERTDANPDGVWYCMFSDFVFKRKIDAITFKLRWAGS